MEHAHVDGNFWWYVQCESEACIYYISAGENLCLLIFCCYIFIFSWASFQTHTQINRLLDGNDLKLICLLSRTEVVYCIVGEKNVNFVKTISMLLGLISGTA